MRLLALDTETTGLDFEYDRVISIGAVEIKNDQVLSANPGLHMYINPGDDVAMSRDSHAVHKLGRGFLQQHGVFADSVEQILHYVRGAKVLIHNAKFDVGMLDSEIRRLLRQGQSYPLFSEVCTVVDTVEYARKRVTGQVNLNALARKYRIDDSKRIYSHGALEDAILLAKVYLAMTSDLSQRGLELPQSELSADTSTDSTETELSADLIVLPASNAELSEHESIMQAIHK